MGKIMKKPRISIIIPVYNAEAFLRATVSDVLNQTWRDLELILVDDGSKDGSWELCRAIAQEDPRVRVFHKENGGAGSARNVGIRAAEGELIGFVDSDDHIRPDMYEKMLEACDRRLDGCRPAGASEAGQLTLPFLVQTGREEVDEEGNLLPADLITPEAECFEDPESFIRSLLLYTGDASYCTKLVPRSCFFPEGKEPLLFPEGQLGEDFWLHMQMLPDTSGVLRIPETGYQVVHRRGSATRRADASHFSRAYIDIIRHADAVEREVVPVYPALQREAVRFGLYERLDYLLHVPIEDMNPQNSFYADVCRYLKDHFKEMLQSPWLTGKNKLYLTLLTAAPKTVRRVHRMLRGKRLQ